MRPDRREEGTTITTTGTSEEEGHKAAATMDSETSEATQEQLNNQETTAKPMNLELQQNTRKAICLRE